jgi:hypothetical protein
VEALRGVAEGHIDAVELRLRAVACPRRGGDEEVEQDRLRGGSRDQHVAPRAQAGKQRLGHERREHGGDGGIHRIAALAQHARPGAGRQRVTRRDHPSCVLTHG